VSDRSAPAFPQLDLFASLGDAAPALALVPAADPDAGRWRWTRPWLESPHRARARRELDAVRAHFPELDGVAVQVGLTRRRNVLGLASLGAVPAIWIRARRIHRFALAHELVHLLQARGLVPGGEKAADLYALARCAGYVDVAPFYLALPRRAKAAGGRLAPGAAAVLHALAARAVAERRGKTARGAVRAFERAAQAAFGS
jgi:hypothetical protein